MQFLQWMLLISAFLLSGSLPAASPAESLLLQSGPEQNTLIELYTSEGCSSCPPAEKYLNSLKQREDLWQQIIPVAFHVDYWDYIGWKDPYANSAFTRRQRHYDSLKLLRAVYTPAFLVNGKEWRRSWIFSRDPEIKLQHAGNLVADIQNGRVSASYDTNESGILELNIALLGMNLTSHIQTGENAGRTANHEFVVIGYDKHSSSDRQWSITLPALHVDNVTPTAIAIWVNRQGNPVPLQAVGNYYR